MRIVLSIVVAALVPLLAHAAEQKKMQLPSWFPPANGAYKMVEPQYLAYEDWHFLTLPRTSKIPVVDSYNDVHGQVWRFAMDDPKPDAKTAWGAIRSNLEQQGFRVVQGDPKDANPGMMALQKGTDDAPTFVQYWNRYRIAIIVAGPNPFRLPAKPPAGKPEKFTAKEPIPYLPAIEGGKVVKGTNDEKGELHVSPACNGQWEPTGTHRSVRDYEGPPGLSNYAVQQTYEAAMRDAGWQQLCESGSRVLVGHYAKNGRDIWAVIKPNVSLDDSAYSVYVADAGSGLRTDLGKGCKAALYGVNFDFDKATLRPDSEPALNQVLALMKDEPKLAVEIGGHTDNVGKPDYNLKLSDERAASVVQWLVQHGIQQARLTSHGYGDTQPLAPNTNDDNRARNRRVELKRKGCK